MTSRHLPFPNEIELAPSGTHRWPDADGHRAPRLARRLWRRSVTGPTAAEPVRETRKEGFGLDPDWWNWFSSLDSASNSEGRFGLDPIWWRWYEALDVA
jgi:hypothetical protein